MYSVCRSTYPSTQVELSVYCHFYSHAERNLITAGSNQLKIYRLVRDGSSAGSSVPGSKRQKTSQGFQKTKETSEQQESKDHNDGQDNNHCLETNYQGVKLECLQTYQFHGSIDSFAAVSFVGSQRDSLVLAFADAKVSVVEYDPHTHDLKTISMHYFEDEDMKKGTSLSFVRPPEVRVDPQNRCAAILIYNKKLIILPFRKDIVVEDSQEGSERKKSFFTAEGSSKKSPVLPSYELKLNQANYNVNVTNIVDIQFLHNYYNPTLMILYEPIRTWVGRVAIRQDTVSMMTLSLDLNQQNHPQIWNVNNLPFNTFGALPVPKPIGGVIIFSPNALIHLSQGQSPYGISLNCFNDYNTLFPLKPYEGLNVCLGGCKASFMSQNRILLALESGELFCLVLENDRARCVRTFGFTYLGSSVASSCITKCEDGFVFLGSRLSHSVLLYYNVKENLPVQNSSSSSIPNTDSALDRSASGDDGCLVNGNGHAKLLKHDSGKTLDIEDLRKFDPSTISEDEYLYGEEYCKSLKRLRSSVDGEEFADDDGVLMRSSNGLYDTSGIMKSDDEDENETEEAKIERRLFGKKKPVLLSLAKIDPKSLLFKLPPADMKDSKFFIKLCDHIMNIAPCGFVTIGEPTEMIDDEMVNHQDFDVEIVTTSGFKKSGALSVLQRSIKPRIETSFELDDCVNVWTLKGRSGTQRGSSKILHEFMIISQSDKTIVFQIGNEIDEIEDCGFKTDSPTIATGNLGDNKYILQVCEKSVTLLEGTKELQKVPLHNPIVSASIVDPYAVLLMDNGQIMILCLKTDGKKGSAKFVANVPKMDLTVRSPVNSFCVYRNLSDLFTLQGKKSKTEVKLNNVRNKKIVSKKNNPESVSLSSFATTTSADDEDELLYGDSLVCYLRKSEPEEDEETETEEEKSEVKITTISGKKEANYWIVLTRSNGQLEIYRLPDFTCVFSAHNFSTGPRFLADDEGKEPQVKVEDKEKDKEKDKEEEEPLPQIKEILVAGMGLHSSRPILFSRFDAELVVYEAFAYHGNETENRLKLRFRKLPTTDVFVRYPEMLRGLPEAKLPKNDQWLRTFANICGYSGVFLCGPHPVWFLMTDRGELRVHGMELDGPVTSFAPLNSISCKNGFLYFNGQNDLRICRLSNYFNLDGNWPFKQIPVGDTVNYVAYHAESKVYVIVRTRMVKMERIYRVGGEEKDFDEIEPGNGYIHCQQEQYDLVLVSPIYWEVIPGSLVELEEFETVTCLKVVYLASEGTSSGLKGYIAMGTNYSYGEDVTSRGRIFIMDVIEVVPEPGQPMTKNKLKTVYAKEQKGPVTCLAQVKGFLLAGIGQKIYIWQLKENDLVGIAFIDTQIYAIDAMAIKNLILVSDVYKSVFLLQYEDETRTLSLISRDHRPLKIYASDFLIDNNDMSFLVSDAEKNLIVYGYQPEIAESYGGSRLLRRGDYHLGSHVNSFFRMRCFIPFIKSPEMKKQWMTFAQRHITMFATLKGEIGLLLPIPENVYRRLFMLQNLITTGVQHLAGLNPRSWRQIKTGTNELYNSNKNILDGELIFQYLTLPFNERAEIAKKIGTQQENVDKYRLFEDDGKGIT